MRSAIHKMASSSEGGRLSEAKEALKGSNNEAMQWKLYFLLFLILVVKDISDLLNTGLDDETLKVCVQLLEAGVNPEALASVVKELRRAVASQVHNTDYE